LQKWYLPNLSEQDILSKNMSEIMVNILQMQMESKANRARTKWEKKNAEKLAKQNKR
jgi:hypothetical protein